MSLPKSGANAECFAETASLKRRAVQPSGSPSATSLGNLLISDAPESSAEKPFFTAARCSSNPGMA